MQKIGPGINNFADNRPTEREALMARTGAPFRRAIQREETTPAPSPNETNNVLAVLSSLQGAVETLHMRLTVLGDTVRDTNNWTMDDFAAKLAAAHTRCYPPEPAPAAPVTQADLESLRNEFKTALTCSIQLMAEEMKNIFFEEPAENAPETPQEATEPFEGDLTAPETATDAPAPAQPAA